MFGYEARLEKFCGRYFWMIYRRWFGIRVFIERWENESSCNMRLRELRGNISNSVVDVICWIIVAFVSALVVATWLVVIAVLWKIAL